MSIKNKHHNNEDLQKSNSTCVTKTMLCILSNPYNISVYVFLSALNTWSSDSLIDFPSDTAEIQR